MAIGPSSPSPAAPIDDASLDKFLHTNLPAEEWQKRIATLQTLVHSIPDYSTSAALSPHAAKTPWYRSSKHVRRLFPSLKAYILDARSAVVKEATELIGTLFMVKLQHHPNADEECTSKPPPPFVGRLLLKDLLPTLLQLSSQTVKVIRTYGSSLLLDILPHCRVPSSLVLLCERIKSDKNRCVKEDCSRYLRCVLETWPVDEGLAHCISVYMESKPDLMEDANNNNNTVTTRFRKDECLTVESVKLIGSELGRSLSDPAQEVRKESRLGFQVLFRRFRPIWDDVMRMNSGVVRDVRLRKKLLEAAARSDGRDVEDLASLDDGSVGGMSYSSARSGISQLTFRSYASRGPRVPNNVDTPKKTRVLQTSREAISDYSTNTYVTSSGQVLQTPSPRRPYRSPRRTSGQRGGPPVVVTEQPFASLLKTPSRNDLSPINQRTPLGLKTQKASSNVLRKRLSRRISGVDAINGSNNPLYLESNGDDYRRQLSSINETDDNRGGQQLTTIKSEEEEVENADTHLSEVITTVAVEVIGAHLSHLKQLEAAVSKEKELLAGLEKLAGSSLLDKDLKSSEVQLCLAKLSQEKVEDYFESVHACVVEQVASCEDFIDEMVKISQGGEEDGQDLTGEFRELAQSP
ncbi:hypothetical protein ACHAXN_012859 [Cyclotella atomus]